MRRGPHRFGIGSPRSRIGGTPAQAAAGGSISWRVKMPAARVSTKRPRPISTAAAVANQPMNGKELVRAPVRGPGSSVRPAACSGGLESYGYNASGIPGASHHAAMPAQIEALRVDTPRKQRSVCPRSERAGRQPARGRRLLSCRSQQLARAVQVTFIQKRQCTRANGQQIGARMSLPVRF